MSTAPYKDSALAHFIARRVLELRPKTQADIASEAGFADANFISMLKIGTSKLALDRVPALATALECDPALLLRLALEQAVGSTAALALQEILGTPVSANERPWLSEIRDASGQIDPRPTARARATIKGSIREMIVERMARRVVDGFKLPWDGAVTENERARVEFLRIIWNDAVPVPDSDMVMSAGAWCCNGGASSR